jgi:hypothetical protein
MPSSLELRVSAAIIQQRPAVAWLGALDLGDEDRVIAAFVVLDGAALEVRERVIEQDDAAVAARIGDAVEAIGVGVGEPARVGFLIR